MLKREKYQCPTDKAEPQRGKKRAQRLITQRIPEAEWDTDPPAQRWKHCCKSQFFNITNKIFMKKGPL